MPRANRHFSARPGLAHYTPLPSAGIFPEVRARSPALTPLVFEVKKRSGVPTLSGA